MMDTNTHLNNNIDEQLVILMEECSEVIQACAKLLRHGADCYNPKYPSHDPNIEQLNKEVADLEVTIRVLDNLYFLDREYRKHHANNKLSILRNRTVAATNHYPLPADRLLEEF